MRVLLTEKLAPWTGVAFVVFAAASFLTTPGDFLDDPQLLVDRYENELGLYLSGAQMAAIAAASLLWFSSTVAAAIVANGAGERLAGLARSGGTVATALFLGGMAIIAVGAPVADAEGQIAADSASVLFNSGAAIAFGAMPVGAGVLVAATGLASLRGGHFLPGWLGWASLVLAVALLIPVIAFVAVLGFFAWVLILAGLMIGGRLAFAEPEISGGG